MKFIKEHWKFLLFVFASGLIGGYSTGLYFYDTLAPDMLKELQEQNITKEIYSIILAIQYSTLYGIVLAAIGGIISKKINLWKKFKYHKEAIIPTIIITLVGTLILFPGDKLIFGPLSTYVKEYYTKAPSIPEIISGLLIGGVIEEVMLRLFFMSLLVFIMKIIFYRKTTEIPVKVFVIANFIAAFLFALGHIPSTMTMTTLTKVLIIRCIAFNGILGLSFGYLYRKHGIMYAMISHGLCHLIADILMILFI